MITHHTRCVLCRLRCNGHSLLFNSYLTRVCRIVNLLCSAYGHPLQDIYQLILRCPATDSAPLALWRLFAILQPLFQALESFTVSEAPWSSAMPPSLERDRVTITTTPKINIYRQIFSISMITNKGRENKLKRTSGY